MHRALYFRPAFRATCNGLEIFVNSKAGQRGIEWGGAGVLGPARLMEVDGLVGASWNGLGLFASLLHPGSSGPSAF